MGIRKQSNFNNARSLCLNEIGTGEERLVNTVACQQENRF